MENVFAILFGVVCGILAAGAMAWAIVYGMNAADSGPRIYHQQAQIYPRIVVDETGAYILAGGDDGPRSLVS